jgi:hypothetical protein
MLLTVTTNAEHDQIVGLVISESASPLQMMDL